MSAEVLQSFAGLPPLKRARESMGLNSVGLSKCGEVFVTNTADKWSFFCAQCEKVTSDIGVFICHIRLDHLTIPTTTTATVTQMSPVSSNQIVSTAIVPLQQNDSSPPPLVQISSMMVTNQEIPPKNQQQQLQHQQQQQQQQRPLVKNDIVIEEERISETIVKPEAISVSKIVDLTSLTNTLQDSNNETSTSNQTPTPSTSSQTAKEISEEFYTINFMEEENEQSLEFRQLTNTSDEVNIKSDNQISLKVELDQQEEENEKDLLQPNYVYDIRSETESPHTESDNEQELNDMDNKQRTQQPNEASVSFSAVQEKPKRKKKLKGGDCFPHKCPICNQGFRSKQGVHFHICKVHDKDLHQRLPYKCNECQRGFKTIQGLKYHKITHDTEKHYKCPLCPATPYKLNIFINHMLSHESPTCYPCQVCGQVYPTNEQRMEHWKTHEEERPFGCNFCFRRFRKQQYLIHHLKSHNQYLCNFCLAEFHTQETQKPPYACPTCEKLPDIKRKVELQRTFLDKTHAFESDED